MHFLLHLSFFYDLDGSTKRVVVSPVRRLSEAGSLPLATEEGEVVVVQLVVDAVLHNVLQHELCLCPTT